MSSKLIPNWGYEINPKTDTETNLVNDAEVIYRFFLRRDEMNAEVHSMGQTKVRYSPITLAAERVLNSLYAERYKYEDGGIPEWKQASDFNKSDPIYANKAQ